MALRVPPSPSRRPRAVECISCSGCRVVTSTSFGGGKMRSCVGASDPQVKWESNPTPSFHRRTHDFTIKGVYRGWIQEVFKTRPSQRVWGRKSPSGVQGQSPVGFFWGKRQSPLEPCSKYLSVVACLRYGSLDLCLI